MTEPAACTQTVLNCMRMHYSLILEVKVLWSIPVFSRFGTIVALVLYSYSEHYVSPCQLCQLNQLWLVDFGSVCVCQLFTLMLFM